MDKFEYKVKLEEINSLIREKSYADAVDVADTIDWNNVKNVRTLCRISDLYKANHLFSESMEVLLLAYKRQKTRPIVRSLCELSIELGDLISAIEYFKEFASLAPNDPGKYILQYKIYKAQKVSLEEQIGVLEELKEQGYMKDMAKWAYELAELYHRVGQGDKCVEECNEIILWFVDGKYVIKAYELKALHQPLNEQETYKYELLRQAGGELNIQYSLREDEKPENASSDELKIKNVDVSPYNTQNLQAVVAEGLQDIIDSKTTQFNKGQAPLTYEEAVALDEQAINDAKEAELRAQGAPTVAPADANKGDENLLVTQVIDPIINEEPVGQELLEEPLKDEGDNASEDTEKDKKEQASQGMGNIREITFSDANTDGFSPIAAGVEAADIENASVINPVSGAPVESKEAPSAESSTQQSTSKKGAFDSINSTGVIEKFHKGTNMDEVLSQGYDGQISLVVPEEQPKEKQITGQISISDVMGEWERKKREAEEKRVAEVKARIKKETKTLLADFDESTKSGLLEQIEDAMINAAIKEEKAGLPKEIKVSDIDSLNREELSKPKQEHSDTEELIKKALDEDIKENKAEGSDDEISEITEAPEDIEGNTDEGVEELTEIEENAEDINISDTDTEADEGEEVSPDEEKPEDIEEEPISKKPKKPSKFNTKKINSEEVRNIAKASAVEASDDDTDGEKKTRELTDSEKEQFAAFIHHRSTRKQLAETLDNVSLAAYTGNVLVSGEEETEVTAFSKLLIKEIQQSDNNFTGKVAKVSGDNLNRKDIAQTVKTVANGALIISEAEKLKAKTVDSLISELQSNELGIVIILEGHSDTMDKLSENIKGFGDTFNLRVDLKAFDDKTLVEYAKTYAYDQEYTIDDFGVLALHTRIADMQTAEHEVTLSEIEEIIDEAIYYADKKTPAHFFDVLFGKRYDEEDMIVLREKDFMHY